ncbi:hypothetical protein [Hymenobacter norwichensis]|uniref:hypothetical protein n=1 Tax=Hymenobacter norwichensis TaxID=223903 RepID=UPI0003B67126|nr:hypothetical protein [Hymenobacter norwichensis]
MAKAARGLIEQEKGAAKAGIYWKEWGKSTRSAQETKFFLEKLAANLDLCA